MQPLIFKSDEDGSCFPRHHFNLDCDFNDRAHLALIELPLLNHFEDADVALMWR